LINDENGNEESHERKEEVAVTMSLDIEKL
jgi:hypothetical protein